MDLQNGYKALYDKATGTKRAFYASRTGAFADADKIAEFAMGTYKLIYEKNGQLYGSITGVPTEGDYCFEEFDKIFKEEPEEDPKDAAGTDTGTDAGDDAGATTETQTETPSGATIETPLEEEGEL